MLHKTKKSIDPDIYSRTIILIANIGFAAIIALQLNNIAVAQEITQTSTPTVIDNILINPDIGITDHQTFNINSDPWWNIPSHPKTSVVYFRWYWEELENIFSKSRLKE